MSSLRWYRRLNRFQWTILVVAWLGWVFDIMDTALFNFAKVPMMTEMLGPTGYKIQGPRIEGLIQSWFLIGWAIGGLIFGILADRWGRTRTLIVTILMYCTLTGLTALCRSPEQVMVARFLTALGIGGEWAAGAALVAESFPDDLRGVAASLLQCAAAFGPVFAALANLALAHSSWRALFVVGVLPAFVCVLIRMRVPEPARKAQASGTLGFSGVDNAVPTIRMEEGLASRLPAKLRFRHFLCAPWRPWLIFARENTRSRKGAKVANRAQLGAGFLSELFANPKWRRNTIVAMVIGVVGVTGAGIAPFWIPNLVKEASVGLSEAVVRTRTSNATMVIHIGTLFGVFAFPLLADRIGRKKAFAFFFVGSPIATALALYGGADYNRLLLLMPLATFFAIGVSAGFVLYFPELFPTHLRATGSGLAYNVGRIFSTPIPWLTGIVMGALNGNVVSGVLIASCIYLFGLLAIPFAPETKGQPLPD